MEHAPDDYRGHDPQDAPYIICPECGGEIYKTDPRYQWDTDYCDICEECFMEHVKSLTPEEVAVAMGLRVERVT